MEELKEKLIEVTNQDYNQVTQETNMQKAGVALRDILTDHGLGIALMTAYLHGLKVGHIPVNLNNSIDNPSQGLEIIHEKGKDDYKFVHVPVRQIRKNKDELKERGIMNKQADPISYIYHEDGLVGVFSFDLDALRNNSEVNLNKSDIVNILEHLHSIGLLIQADVHNRQIQFKDATAKELIAKSRDKVYVRSEQLLPTVDQLILPKKYAAKPVKKFILDSIRYKGPCNYCSVSALNPLEATIHSTPRDIVKEPEGRARSTVRNYQFGFTFAPFGDPETLCHFLAWDFPHIHEQVMNMDPQWYSFSDLITLVSIINKDIEKFCEEYKIKDIPTISGVCNHWAGNSIYHQHYQFFHLLDIPALSIVKFQDVARIEDVIVRRLEWEMPVYEIRSSANNTKQIISVAESIARIWEQLNDNVENEDDRYDKSYGNGIRIKKYTQNIFVTIDNEEEMRALFVPRHRSRLNAEYKIEKKDRQIKKGSMAVLETLGYFVIDDKEDFDLLKKIGHSKRNECGRNWLTQITPAILEDSKNEFEEKIKKLITSKYVHHFSKALNSARNNVNRILSIQREIQEANITPDERLYLLRIVNSFYKIISPDNVYDEDALQKLSKGLVESKV